MNMIHNKPVDGLRGLAALNVALAHFACAFTPMLLHRNYPDIFSENSNPSKLFELLQTPLISLSYNGHLAVLIFFVLSGFVLSMPYYRNNLDAIKSRLWGRYIRLNLPIAASVTLSYVIYEMGGFYNTEAAEISGSTSWLSNFFPEGITFSNYFELATYKSILYGDGLLNPPLWTLKIEFLGSIFLLVYYLCKPTRYEILTLSFAILLLYWVYKNESIYYISIFIGALLNRFRVSRGYALSALIAGLFFGAFQSKVPVYQLLPDINLFGGVIFDKKTFYNTVSALLIVLAVVNGVGKRFLESKSIQFLGRISFPLYLVHFIVLPSITSYLYITLPLSEYSLLFIFSSYLVICFAFSWAFEVTIDKYSISLAKYFSTKLLR